MIKRYLLLYYTIFNTRPSQLYHRLRLLIKRTLLSNLANDSFAGKIALPAEFKVSLASNLPPAVFKPREQFVRTSNNSDLEVGFLNVWQPLQTPMNWHPVEMKTGTRLWLLNLHYMEFIEATDTEIWFRFIKDWINRNKPYKKGYWLDDWNSYALSIRVVVWMQQFERRGGSLSEGDKALFLRSLVGQINFLKSNLELDIGGNHLVKNIKALLWASKFFEGPEADCWRELGSKLLRLAIEEQVTPDGVHFELSPAYHVQVFADFLECYTVLDDGETRRELKSILPKMAQFCVDATHPDGMISLFSDSGLHMSYSASECLSVFECLLNIKVKQSELIVYPRAGYFGLRNADTLFLMDAAELAPKYLPGHGHGDALSFEWSVAGQRVAIDPGVFEYNSGDMRAYSQSTLNHNTVTLDDLDQTEFWKSFRAGRRAKITSCEAIPLLNGISVDAAHDGYTRLKGKPTHRRRVIITSGKIEIYDSILGGDAQHSIARVMLAPDILVNQINGQYFLQGKGFSIKVESDRPISVNDTFCFLDFGHKYQTKQLIIDMGYAPCKSFMYMNIIPDSR